MPYLDLDCNNLEVLKDKEIYIPQNLIENNLSICEGKIIGLEKYTIIHNANLKSSSSGIPIFLKNTTNVIGIISEINKYEKENNGNLIYSIINKLNEKVLDNATHNKNEYNISYLKDNFEGNNENYYIGEWKNGLRNGKGKLYYNNGNLQYEGDFVNDKFEGNGKYISKNGKYYIGEWKNGLKDGKGKFYYQNKNLIYEGDWVKDKPEGYGKRMLKNGKYYIGEWKNGLRNGKGKFYYNNGNLKYEGDWINDKCEGNGKVIFENGNYYIGEWKNGLRNGKGKFYYNNGNLIYEGDWINDKYEGIGKWILKNGNYYIGEWKNGLINGKGNVITKMEIWDMKASGSMY